MEWTPRVQPYQHHRDQGNFDDAEGTLPHVDFPSVGIAKSNISFQTYLIFLFPDNSCVARMTGELLDSPLLFIVYHPFLELASKIRQ